MRRNSKPTKIYLLKVKNEQIYFHSNVNDFACCIDEPTIENTLAKPERAAAHLPGANITKPPPLAVVILLVRQPVIYVVSTKTKHKTVAEICTTVNMSPVKPKLLPLPV